MILLALDDDAILPYRDDAADDAHLVPSGFQLPSLLDMQFEAAFVTPWLQFHARQAG